jgi:hypothetical protein
MAGGEMKKRCQSCANADIIKSKETDKEMPLILCGIDPRRGWDAVREWGQVCDKWKSKESNASLSLPRDERG